MSQDVMVRPEATAADAALSERVAAAIKASPQVPPDRVTVAAQDGVVTLSGHVNWKYQSAAAVAAATGVNGARLITNQIVVDIA